MRPAATFAPHSDAGRLDPPVLVVHGGAGTFERVHSADDVAVISAGLTAALDAGWVVLEGGGDAVDAAVEAVAAMEDSGMFNAGRGAVPTTTGTVEFDASVMGVTGERGGKLVLGALCAATYPANPVKAAMQIASRGGVPDGPILLAGAGADQFCADAGLERMQPEWLRARQAGQSPSSKGTVGAVALDGGGRVAAATSTGGRSGQQPGRVGDSPVPGAGVLGTTEIAISATGVGEAFLAAGFSHRVAWSQLGGRGLTESMEHALRAVHDLGGEGGAIAVTPQGEFAASFSSRAMARAWRSGAGSETRVLRR